MGIPSYFSYIVKRHPEIIKKFIENKFVVNNLYLDCNSIIYDSYHKLNSEEITESISDKIIKCVICKIEEYLAIIQPNKNVIIAFDGVAPVAKLEQQRQRRYKSWYQSEISNQIFRNEKNQEPKTFDITGANIVILDANNNTIKTVEDFNFPSKTLKIFEKIKQSEETTFEISEAQEVMDILLCKSIKADNNTKADIDAEIYDRVSNSISPLGFSVKSIVGGASTLLNEGKTTNFVFKINGLNAEHIESINAIDSKSKVQDRIKAIVDNGGSLEFQNVARKEFEANLRKIDTVFPAFIAQMLADFF